MVPRFGIYGFTGETEKERQFLQIISNYDLHDDYNLCVYRIYTVCLDVRSIPKVGSPTYCYQLGQYLDDGYLSVHHEFCCDLHGNDKDENNI